MIKALWNSVKYIRPEKAVRLFCRSIYNRIFISIVHRLFINSVIPILAVYQKVPIGIVQGIIRPLTVHCIHHHTVFFALRAGKGQGPEVLTGSTRLKAGTTTKLILNMISTISMISIGKIYKNYMVDVKMSNEKLLARGTNIVSAVTGCSKEDAKEALAKSDGGVRTAIVMILLGCGKEEAENALKTVNGQIQNLVKGEQK